MDRVERVWLEATVACLWSGFINKWRSASQCMLGNATAGSARDCQREGEIVLW